jgi:siroheme synthase
MPVTPVTPVAFVGAGPGDPLLLTRRAARLLGEADVVVADRPSADAVLALARPDAARVYVGRMPGVGKAWTLDAIVDRLAAEARTGRRVVRLKSGDPFVCSRAAEEVAALAAQGVECSVTPGVTAATAAPLAAAMPRGRRVTFVSGDRDPVAAPVDWAALADPRDSVVVLTGRSQQAAIAERLLAAGLPSTTPAAVVHAATRPEVDIVTTTLADLGDHRLPPPAAFVVGPIGPIGPVGLAAGEVG